MALVYDNTRTAKKGGGWQEWSGPLGDEPGGWVQELARRRADAAAELQRHKNTWNTIGKFATMAATVPFSMAAGPTLTSLGSIGRGGAAAAASSAAGAGAAGAVASNLSAHIPWLRLAEIGVPAITNLFGMRAGNKAADRAHALDLEAMRQNQANYDKQYALEREAFEAEQEQARLDRAAADETRAFDRKMIEDREGRRAPYRAIGRNALFSLADIARVRG